MRDPDDNDLTENHKSQVINSLYDVALDPARYEDLIDIWDERIAPLRKRSGEAGEEFRDAILEGHMLRAGQVLDRDPPGLIRDPRDQLMTSLLPTAAFIINGRGEIVHANSAAVVVFGLRDGSTVPDLPFHAAYCEELAENVEAVSGRTGAERFVRCQARGNGRLIVFRLSSMDAQRFGPGHVLAVSTELVWPDSLSQTMREAFRLTQAEVDIVRGLVEGDSVSDIAKARGRSLETVRTQLRSILGKTQTKAQAELIRVTLNLMDVVAVGAKPASPILLGTASQLAPVPFQTLWRPDGRRADYIEFGDPEGQPILYLPLDMGLIRWPASAEAELERRKFRVIVPIRPGYGHSSPLSKKADRAEAVISDMIALLDHLDIATCPVIALGSDGFYAFKMAQDHPGRLTAIMLCGCSFPVLSREQYERMGKWHRFILANARYAPKVLPFLVKAGFSLARRIGKKGFLKSVYGSAAGDVATYEDPEVFDALVVGSEITLSDWHSAHDAFAAEIMVSQYDWSDLIHACPLPVTCYIGLENQMLPRESLSEVETAFPAVRLVKDESAGELVFFKRWRDVLDDVSAYLRR